MGSSSGLGAITDFVGLTDYGGAEDRYNQSLAASAAATQQSAEVAKMNIDFQREVFNFEQEQYNEWKNTFGSLSENLSEYYNNLTASSYATKGLQAEATEYQRSLSNVQAQMAQRGISSSGAEAAAITALGAQSASNRTNIRASAEDQVRAQQVGFLGLGLGQGTQYLGVMGQQASNVGSAYNTQANAYLQGGLASANTLAAQGAGMMSGSYGIAGSLIGAAGSVAGGYAMGSAMPR